MAVFALGSVMLVLATPLSPARDFARDREAAVGRGATAADLAEADRLADRAARAPARLAARLTRAARWALPAAPRDLGEHVARVLGGERLRHAGRVNSLAYAANARLVSSSVDGSARVWDLGGGREVLAYRGHPQVGAAVTDVFNVGSAAAGPGTLAASAGGGEIHIWDRATGVRARTIKAAAGATVGLAFAADGKTLYAAGDDGALAAFAVDTGAPVGANSPAAESRAESLALDPAGRFVAVGTLRGAVAVTALGRDGRPGARVGGGAVAGGEAAVSAAAFVPGSTNLLVGARDGTLKLLAVPAAGVGGKPAVLKAFPAHPGRVQALVALPGGVRFATGSSDGAARVWDLATGALKSLHPLAEPAAGESDGGVTALAVSPDGSELAVGTFDGAIKLVPLAPDDEGLAAADAAGPVWALAAGPTGVIAAAGADGAVRLYDPASGNLERTLPARPGAVSALAFDGPDKVLTGGSARRLERRAVAEGQSEPLAEHAGAVLAVAADPRRGRVWSGGVGGELVEQSAGKPESRTRLGAAVCAICVLETGPVAVGLADGALVVVDNGKVTHRAAAHPAGTAALAAGPGGALYSVGGDGALRAWFAGPGGVLKPGRRADRAAPPAGTPGANLALAAVAVAPDGKSVATAGADSVVRVHSTIDLSETRAFRGHAGWVTGLAFTADGRAIFSAGADKTVRRFELPRPDAAAGHAGPVTAVALSPDGLLVATGSADRSAKVWDRPSGKLLATLPGPSAVAGVAFTKGGELVTGSQDGVVRWWDWRAGTERRAAAVPGGRRVIFLLAADAATGLVAVAWGGDGRAGAHRFDADAKEAGSALSGEASAAALSGDAARVAFATDDGILVADLEAPVDPGAPPPAAPWVLFEGGTVDLGLSRDGATLVGVGDKSGTTVDGYPLATAARVARVAGRAAGEPVKLAGAIGVAVAPSGDRYLAWDALGGVALYEKAGGEARSWKLPSAARVATVSPDARLAAVGHRDGTATVLELGP